MMNWLQSSSDMAERVRQHDWASTPLGPLEHWPDVLKTTVALCFASSFPQSIIWGPQLTMLYNDAFIPILGDKPYALGRPFSEVWHEVWADIGPIAKAAFEGHATFIENFPLLIERGSGPEQAYFTFCYSPIRDPQGKVVGMLDTVTETTTTVFLARRLAVLDAVGSAVATATDAESIMSTTTRLLAEHLQVSNCAYADMDADEDGFTIRGNWAAPGSPSIVGRYSLASFGARAVRQLRAGEPLVVVDNRVEFAPEEAASYQALGVLATVCFPLIKEGRLTALMAVHDKSARVWSPYDLALVREVTERSWAHIERVRADAAVRDGLAAFTELNATLEQRVRERTTALTEAEAALRDMMETKVFGASGDEVVIEGDGLMAQALQHECDHLDGKLYLNRLDRESRGEAMRQIRASTWF